MKDEARQAYLEAMATHKSLYEMAQRLDAWVKTCSDPRELADCAYAMREASKLLDDARKTLNAVQGTSEKIACVLWTRDPAATGAPIRTSHCTATPDVRMIASIPKKKHNPEAYAALMRWAGVPDELSMAEEEVVRLHWPGFVVKFSELLAEGKPLPPGVDPNKTYPEYKLKITGRKEVNASAT